MSDYYDKTGQPIDTKTWIELFKNQEYKRIKLDTLGNVTVSTVWLGIDYNFGPKGKPIIFETMIFGGEHDNYQERYTTEAEAIEGHKRACELVGIQSVSDPPSTST